MLQASTIKLLRLPFSVFLSPIYFFALSQAPVIDWVHAILIFVILHLLIYPASNGYNSYMDRDTGPIGGLEKPPPPSRELYYTTIVLDLAGIALGFAISPAVGLFLPLYIAASKAYSYRRIRLKQYPVTGYLTVILVQGAFTFLLVWVAAVNPPWARFAEAGVPAGMPVPWSGALICALLIGGFYPLTQIYQHRQDASDGVRTISYVLGYRGTFVFCAFVYAVAWGMMAQFFILEQQPARLLVVSVLLLPVVIFFVRWARKVWRHPDEASFRNTMRMNWTAAICTNLAFFILLIWRFF